MKKIARIKESNIIGVLGKVTGDKVAFTPNGSADPIIVMQDAIEIIGWVKVIVEFFIKLFKKKDLPTQFMYEGDIYKYYSYMEQTGLFVAGYTKISGEENIRFRVFSKTKIRTKNLLRKTLKEYKLL